MRISNEVRLVAMIDREAGACGEGGEAAFTNDDIAGHFNFGDYSAATTLVSRARARGLIETRYPTTNTRVLVITAAGRAALNAVEQKALIRAPRHVDVSGLSGLACDDGPALRLAAAKANDRFLAAMAKVAPVPDGVDRDRGVPFNRLPPPALTGQAFS